MTLFLEKIIELIPVKTICYMLHYILKSILFVDIIMVSNLINSKLDLKKYFSSKYLKEYLSETRSIF